MPVTETPPPFPRRPEPQNTGRGGRGWPPRSLADWRSLPMPGGPWLIVRVLLALLVIYGAYFWLIRRVVVDPDKVLVLMKKDGDRSLSGDQTVIPDPKTYPGGATAWEEAFGDPHPGDGAWHPMVAVVPVPATFAGGEARIGLLHAQGRGWSEFANVAVAVR